MPFDARWYRAAHLLRPSSAGDPAPVGNPLHLLHRVCLPLHTDESTLPLIPGAGHVPVGYIPGGTGDTSA